MKILFLGSGSIRSNFTYRIMALGRALHARGHDVAVIAPKADKYNDFKPETITELDGVRVLQPFQFATKRLEINLLPYMIGAIRMTLREKPDLVYIYKPTPISIVGLIAKLRGTRIVLDMDDLGSEVMKIEGHPVHQRLLVQLSEHLAARHANRIVAASTYLYNRYRKHFSDKPVCLLPNGVDSDWFDKPVALSHEKKRIVFMGSLNRRNIIEPLFDVLPKLVRDHPEVKVLVMGDGQCKDYFVQKVQDMHLDEHVEFTGWLALEDAFKRLQSGDIGYNYMPNELTVRAASNMKIPQYMARGVVPLVSNMGDLPKAVNNGRAGYIAEPGDLQSLETTLQLALADPTRAKKAAHAREYSRETFGWDKLAAWFDDWVQGKAPRGARRVFVIASDQPGDFGGAPIRNYQLVKELAHAVDTEVELFCTTNNAPDEVAKTLEQELPIKAHVVHKQPPRLRSTLRALLVDHMQPFMTEYRQSGLGGMVRAAAEDALPDAIQIEQLDAYFALRPHLKWLQDKGVKIVLDAHNVELEAFKGAVRTFPFAKRMVGHWLTPAYRDLEQEAITTSDVVLACSPSDAAYFKQMRGDNEVHLIPNGVDCKHFSPVSKHNVTPNLLFIGGTGYPANSDALDFYMREIHPLVKVRVHNAKVLAIGTSHQWAVEHGFHHDHSLVPLGFVDDIKEQLDQAVIGICPIREGSGTRLKVLTYMAAGLGVVSTAKGSEGIQYGDGQELIIADEPQAFADAIVTLLLNRTALHKMGQAGRQLTLETYNWPVIGEHLKSFYRELLP